MIVSNTYRYRLGSTVHCVEVETVLGSHTEHKPLCWNGAAIAATALTRVPDQTPLSCSYCIEFTTGATTRDRATA